MALFGNRRDVNLFTTVNRELIRYIISQEVGYYKYKLNDTGTIELILGRPASS